MIEEELKKLIDEIKNNKISQLNLYEKNLGEEGIKNISEALNQNTSLQNLNIRSFF
jgi:hypothetical protein